MKKLVNQAGQSTIEFIFCFIFAVSLILLVFNTSLNYAAGYVVHYATFMASRVFLTQSSFVNVWGPSNRGGDIEKAQEAFRKYDLSVFGISNDALKIQDEPQSAEANEYLMIGAYTKFERKMDLVGKITGGQKLELVSESYLGREPTLGVCASRTCKGVTDQDQCNAPAMDITLFDNGC
jgi:hypothetical protein